MSGVDGVDHLGRVGEEPLELLVGLLLVDELDRLDLGVLLEVAAHRVDLVWVASGCMKTMNSMPPCQRVVAFSTPWRRSSEHADERERRPRR